MFMNQALEGGTRLGAHLEDSAGAAEHFCVESDVSFLNHALANLARKINWR